MANPGSEDAPDLNLIYEETFDTGPGAWVTGRELEDGGWHRNIFGHHGGPVPLGWSESDGRTGAYAYTEPPWYFDDNHGQFAWLYLAFFVNRSSEIGLEGQDLREAVIELTVRGSDFELRGTTLYFWIQGDSRRPEDGGQVWNWALTSQPIDTVLSDGEWHDLRLILRSDENEWSFMGMLNGGLARKVTIGQSLDAAEGTLDGILGGGHVNLGFLLCGVDPNDAPTGHIDVDAVRFLAR